MRQASRIDDPLTHAALLVASWPTSAAICREAGIATGTFFHYFPTKLDLLLAILDLGTHGSRDWFGAQEGRTDPAQVVTDYVEHAASEFSDPRLPG